MRGKGSGRLGINLALVAVLVAVGVGAYLILGGGGGEAAQGQTVTATVTRGTVRSTVSASGTIASAETADADFTTDGTVTELLVDVGDRVRKGQILARVDDSSGQADLQSAYASASSAQAGLTSARASLSSAYANLRELKRNDASDAELAQGEAQVASAQAQIDQAEASIASASAQVTQAQGTVAGTVLRAPIAGTVVEVNGAVGQASSSASSSDTSSDTSGFLVISDLRHLRVQGYFSETDTAQLEAGQRARVTVNVLPDELVTGTVSAIDETSTTVNQVVDYGVTVDLHDAPKDVRIGQTATVVVVTGRATDVLVVPSAAVQTAGGQDTVTVVRNGREVPTAVEVGLEGDQLTEIVSGLSEGDEVAISSANATGTNGFPGGGFPGGGLVVNGGPGA